MEIPQHNKFLPPLEKSARSLATRTRKRHKRYVALRLSLVTLGALFGALAITGKYRNQVLDYAGVAGVLAFIGVLGVRLAMQSDSDLEDAEPRGNALAELITSHAWRFAVGARGYAIGSPELDDVAGRQFRHNMESYQKILSDYSITAPVSRQITDDMYKIRKGDLSERREIYLAQRVRPLQAASSTILEQLARRWRGLTILVLLVELIGIPGGVLKAVDLSRIDLLGVTAAAAASIALWIDTLNFQERRRIATATGRNLIAAEDALNAVRSEEEWAGAVARIEERLSLESAALLSPDTAKSHTEWEEDEINVMSPEEYFAAAETLKRKIWEESNVLPKLEPDVIVAVNPGGAILGGILYFMTRASDFLPLSFRGSLKDEDLSRMLQAAPWQPRKQHLSILLVDASVKSGANMKKAIELVKQAVEQKGFVPEHAGNVEARNGLPIYLLRTAVIAKKRDPRILDSVQVDYFVNESTERFPYGNI